MNNPHVVKLTYQLKTAEDITFSSPPPIKGDYLSFKIRLDAGLLTIEMKDHFPTIEDAKLLVEPFLRSWEIDAALFYNNPEIKFAYDGAEVIDLAPSTEHPIEVQVNSSLQAFLSAEFKSDVTRTQYPLPPKTFRVDEDVEILWQRYWGYRQHQEPLLSMAYFCLTYIERKYGDRQSAARELSISKNALDHLGEIVSRKGDFQTARKLDDQSSGTPLTRNEIVWIDDLIKKIIRRMGERTLASGLPQITMNDLPPL